MSKLSTHTYYSAVVWCVVPGRILLPTEYPMKPPSIILLTPNGRFEVGKKICLTISAHHPESWQPSWSSQFLHNPCHHPLVALLVDTPLGLQVGTMCRVCSCCRSARVWVVSAHRLLYVYVCDRGIVARKCDWTIVPRWTVCVNCYERASSHCLSPSAVRTMLLAIITFLPTEGKGAIAALDYTDAERKDLAAK